jgi:uncharacterized protein (DUF2267 family)
MKEQGATMDIFNRLNEQATHWLKDMMKELQTEDQERAWHALRAGLHALRDRLTVEEAAQLSAQLPLVIRGLYFEGWDPTGKPLRIRHRSEFLALVRQEYAPRTDTAAADLVRALFRVLEKHVSMGELTDIMLTLPTELVDVIRDGRSNEERAES